MVKLYHAWKPSTAQKMEGGGMRQSKKETRKLKREVRVALDWDPREGVLMQEMGSHPKREMGVN